MRSDTTCGLLDRHGPAAGYDAVLTGFLFCGHLWAERREDEVGVHREWTRRAEVLIPPGTETATFSASRLFAAVYPEAVRLAGLIASPTWRHLAAGDADQQRQFTTEVGRRLDHPHHPVDGGNAVAHWMMFDCWRPPSRPDRVGAQPGQRDRPLSGAATELEDVATNKVAEDAQLGFRDPGRPPGEPAALGEVLTVAGLVFIAVVIPHRPVAVACSAGAPGSLAAPDSRWARTGPA